MVWLNKIMVLIEQNNQELQCSKNKIGYLLILMMFCGCSGNKKAEQHDHEDSIESPLEIKLLQTLGLKSCILDRFVFRRKQSTYQIRDNQGSNAVYLGEQLYTPPSFYQQQVQILESKGHSVPVVRLTPLLVKNNQRLPCIIYAHGNSSDLGSSLAFISKMVLHFKAQYIAFDYTGYGASRIAHVGEEIITSDLQMVLAWANQPLQNVILWGFSLGTCPVLANAVKHRVRAIVLQCPIGSLACMFYEQFSRNVKFKEDSFANINLIAEVKSRILMMHSTKDEIIPVSQARLLYNKYVAKNGEVNIDYIEVERIKHNAFHQYIVGEVENELQKEVLAFLRRNTAKFGELEQTEASSFGSFNSLEQMPTLPDQISKIRESLTTARLTESEHFDEEQFQISQQQRPQKDRRPSNNYGWMCCQKWE